MATFEEVREGLQHLVIGDIFGDGLKSFWNYTFLRGIKSFGFPEKFSKVLNRSEDDVQLEKKVVEKWAKAWKGVRRERAPEIVVLRRTIVECYDVGNVSCG